MDKKTALKFLNRDYILNVSMIEPLKCDTAEVLFASKTGAFIKDKSTDVYMLETDDLNLADKLLSLMPSSAAIVAHNKKLAEFAQKKLGFNACTPCYQAVYLSQKFVLPLSEFKVRRMREDEADEASIMYGFELESALKHIRLGLVYGGYLKGEIAGMIGMHLQGTMGMLEIKDKFRRKGYAEYMEKFLINTLLDNGKIPYCQIIHDNTASLALQTKLGLKLSKTLIYWLHKD